MKTVCHNDQRSGLRRLLLLLLLRLLLLLLLTAANGSLGKDQRLLMEAGTEIRANLLC